MRWFDIKGIYHQLSQKRKLIIFPISAAYLVERQGGGILNNLTIRFAITCFLLSILTVGCATTTNEIQSKECVENILKAKVVRVDDKNHRFFVVSNIIKSSDIKDNLIQLEKCFVDTKWQPDWALSVFTDSKYAGYKDEEKIIPFHKQNMWAKAYVFEYDHASRNLIKNPAINPEHIMP
jgi:hypothetical protein